MAITKAEIFKIVHERLKPVGLTGNVRSIDNDLRDCLYELSNDVTLLLTATTVTTEADVATVTIPTAMRSWYIAAIDESNFLEGGSIAEYERSIENTDDPATGEPTRIHEFNGSFYLYDPIPDDEYTVRIYGTLESTDVDDIDLANRCREALIWGVMYRLYVGGELLPDPEDDYFEKKMGIVQQQQQNCLGMYERAKVSLRRSAHSEPTRIKYNDMG